MALQKQAHEVESAVRRVWGATVDSWVKMNRGRAISQGWEVLVVDSLGWREQVSLPMGDTWVGQEGTWRMEGVGLWGTVGGIEGDMSVEGAGLWEDSPRRTEGDLKDAGGDLGWWGGIGLWGTVSGKGKRRHGGWKSRPVVRTVRSCSRGHGDGRSSLYVGTHTHKQQ